jgi:hypothetical protein
MTHSVSSIVVTKNELILSHLKLKRLHLADILQNPTQTECIHFYLGMHLPVSSTWQFDQEAVI